MREGFNKVQNRCEIATDAMRQVKGHLNLAVRLKLATHSNFQEKSKAIYECFDGGLKMVYN